MVKAVLVKSDKKKLEQEITEDEFQYVEGGVHKDGKVTFHIETSLFQLYLEFKDEEEFNANFIDSLKEQIEESKQRLKEGKKQK